MTPWGLFRGEFKVWGIGLGNPTRVWGKGYHNPDRRVSKPYSPTSQPSSLSHFPFSILPQRFLNLPFSLLSPSSTFHFPTFLIVLGSYFTDCFWVVSVVFFQFIFHRFVFGLLQPSVFVFPCQALVSFLQT